MMPGCLFVCLFVYLFVCLFTCLFVCLLVCLLVCLIICLFICLFTCLFTCLGSFFCKLGETNGLRWNGMVRYLIKVYIDIPGANHDLWVITSLSNRSRA